MIGNAALHICYRALRVLGIDFVQGIIIDLVIGSRTVFAGVQVIAHNIRFKIRIPGEGCIESMGVGAQNWSEEDRNDGDEESWSFVVIHRPLALFV